MPPADLKFYRRTVMNGYGILFSVGVGPGDPGLMTLKAVETVRRCPVIAAPRTRSGEMLALEIARGAVELDGKAVLPLDFSMARDREKRRLDHERAADAIEAQLREGRDVAMLNLGDVSVYATCGYVRELIVQRGYESVMIPGVTSFCAVAARLDTSLTEPDEPLHIIPGGAWSTEKALELPGTKVLMKPGRSLPEVIAALEKHGCLDRSAMVADCGLPTERVYTDLRSVPDDPGYFVTVVVKNDPSD
jgi:precorrin-2/cobalt-factor-2 C20-methyltransferase